MLIGKECEFNVFGRCKLSGIILEKYSGVNMLYNPAVIEYYIIDTGEKLEHIPCSCLIKIQDYLEENREQVSLIKKRIKKLL